MVNILLWLETNVLRRRRDFQIIKDQTYIEFMSDYVKPELWLWVLIWIGVENISAFLYIIYIYVFTSKVFA